MQTFNCGLLIINENTKYGVHEVTGGVDLFDVIIYNKMYSKVLHKKIQLKLKNMSDVGKTA